MTILGMKVLKAGDNIADVFVGDGWENWARVLRKEGKLIHLKGIKLPKIAYTYLEKEIFDKKEVKR